MATLKQSTAFTRMFLMVDSADHFSPKTGLTVVVTLSKAGGAFAAAGGTVTEVSNGFYKIALTTTDTNTLGDLAFHCAVSGADNTDFVDQVSARIIDDLVAVGGLAVKKNTQLANFEFVMTDSTTHAPKTGVTVTATRSIDGAAFGACANAVSEVASGVYKITLAAADLNGDVITLRFTGTASDDVLITILTQA